MGELIFEGAYVRREIYVSKLVGLASQLEGNLPFLLCSTLFYFVSDTSSAGEGLIFEGAI